MLYDAPLDVLFTRYIREPLGLQRSRFNIAPDEENAAECFERKEVGRLRADDINVRNIGGVAGSGASFWCLCDLEKFMDSILQKSDRIFPVEMYEAAERNYTRSCLRTETYDDRAWGWQIANENNINTGELFPRGAQSATFGHTGWTGVSLFFNRALDLYTIILSNATRWNNIRNDFRGFDFMDTHYVRRDLHNAILADLTQSFDFPIYEKKGLHHEEIH